MTFVADAWPLLVLVALALLLFAVVRLVKRISPGAVGAGPKQPPESLIKSQTDTAEGLRTIATRLDVHPNSMIRRVEGSCRELGVPTDGITADLNPYQQLDILLRRLEAQLGLEIGGPPPTEGLDA